MAAARQLLRTRHGGRQLVAALRDAVHQRAVAVTHTHQLQAGGKHNPSQALGQHQWWCLHQPSHARAATRPASTAALPAPATHLAAVR